MGSEGLVLPDGTPALPSPLTGHSWVVADLDSGKVIAACAPHDRYAPASTLKLLTALTVLPKIDPKQQVTITADDLAFESGSSAVGFVKGGTYSLETVILGLLLVSGNDAANVLARIAGHDGGVAATLKNMNATAAELGARDTHAATPSGLDGDGQATSAYDLALIARALFARKDFSRYTSTEQTTIPAEPPHYPQFQIQNDNELLRNYPGAIGGKTGYTDHARHTYMGASAHNGRRLVVTIMDAEKFPVAPWKQAGALMDWAFALPPGTAPVGQLVAHGSVTADGKARSAGGDAESHRKAAHSARGSGVPLFIAGLLGVTTLVVALGWLGLRRPPHQSRHRARSASSGSADRPRPRQGSRR